MVKRKLAAILAADVAGYSRLIGADEEGTIARLGSHRQLLIDPKIEEHRGRIVKTTGDGMLIEFASAVDAVRCAAEIQRAMADRNAPVREERRVVFRVGINVGDIVVEGDDILGDGVNIAARLEGMAEPGGICISEDAYRQVRDKLSLPFTDNGEQTLKNIARPVRVYALSAATACLRPRPHQACRSGCATLSPLIFAVDRLRPDVASRQGRDLRSGFCTLNKAPGITERHAQR